MRRLARTLALIGLFSLGCDSKREAVARRVELRTLRGNRVELVPADGTPPYCLAFSIAQRGTVRQLTMSQEDKSVECPPGKPIGGVPYRIVPSEGKVRIFVFFSSEKLAAASIAQQISELGASPTFGVLDLRLPGKVVSDVLEYTPVDTANP
jgi:hypothetical protein